MGDENGENTVKTLHEITGAGLALYRMIDEAGGEITEEMGAALDLNDRDLEEKVIGYLEVIGSREALIDRISEEVRRLGVVKASACSTVDYLKARLLMAHETFGDLPAGLRVVKTRISQAVNVTDANILPDEYIRKTTTTVPDKKAIGDALKSGGTVAGACLCEHKTISVGVRK